MSAPEMIVCHSAAIDGAAFDLLMPVYAYHKSVALPLKLMQINLLQPTFQTNLCSRQLRHMHPI